jgi:hypothetical protein
MQQNASKGKGQQSFLNRLGNLKNPRKITMNKKLLIFSFFLLLSVIFWFITALSKNYTTVISYPVRYIKMPEDKVLVSDMPDKLLLTVNTQGYTILRYKLLSRFSPIIFDVNSFRLSSMPGSDPNTVYILTSYAESRIQSQLSPDIELLDISPDSLIFRFSREINTLVPVRSDYEITFDKQFMQSGPLELDPDSILVSGPGALIDTLTVVRTEQRILKNVNKSVDFTAPVIELSRLEYSHDRVKIWIPVEKFTEASLSIPVTCRNLPDSLNIKLFPREIRLTCRVGLSRYDNVSTQSFTATVDYLEIEKNLGSKLQVQLDHIPEYVQSVNFHPKSVEYIIERK